MRVSNVVFILVAGVVAATVPSAASAQKWKDLANKVKQATTSQQSSSQLPGSDIASGLKEALAKGTTHAINTLGKQGGFWNNPAFRIPLPGALQKAGKLARAMGQGKKVDAFQLSMNRAAEKAVPQVADIFGNAIRGMTLSDARGILSGGDHAATDFFRRVAGKQLRARIEPIVAKATDSVGATRKYKALSSGSEGGTLGGALSMLGGHKKSASDHGALDLDGYVTDQTMNALFKSIGNEEKSIRDNPAARSTDLLKKVFGGK